MNALSEFFASSLVERIGWTLAHSLWQGITIGALFAIFLTFLRRSSANTRYLVGCLALVGMAVLPILTFARLESGSPMRPVAAAQARPAVAGNSEAGILELITTEPQPAASSLSVDNGNNPDDLAGAVPVMHDLGSRFLRLMRDFLPWGVAIWLGGIILLTLRLCGGWLRVQRMRRVQTRPAEGAWRENVAHLARRIGISGHVALLESELTDSPLVIGYLKPVILVPASLFTGLSPQQIEGILTHELAHIRRHDYLVNLLQGVIETALFYHPVVWWISSRIRAERENACDDLAVQVCGDRIAYARALTTLEELRGVHTQLALAARRGVLMPRIRRLVGAKEQRSGSTAWGAGFLMILLAGALGFTFSSSEAVAQTEEGGNEALANPYYQPVIVRDRNGAVLVRPNASATGSSFPYRAMAPHLLDALPEWGASNLDFDSQEGPTTLDLTLDSGAQYVVETAMRKVPRGAAVVVDVRNGDILASASVPSFDPNSMTEKRLRALREDPTEPLMNRVLSASAPGSTFKIVTALAGLRKGLARKTFNCSGGVTYGAKFLSCWVVQGKRPPHGTLTLDEALKCSCGPFFYQYGNAAGIDEIFNVSRILGLGMKSGLPVEGEDPGLVPNPEWLRTVSPNERWSPGYTANTAIGQGAVQATPLQMAMVTATIANRGIAYAPRLLRSKPVQVRADLRQLGLPADQIEIVRRGMWKIVNEDGGTGKRASLEIATVAGKTGSAQNWRAEGNLRHRDNAAWFVAFAPYESPRYAVAIRVEGGRSGGGTAAPIAGYILKELLAPNYALRPTALDPAMGSFESVEDIEFNAEP